MLVTEHWLSIGGLSCFADLLPMDCTYFKAPRTSGGGVGVATVFKKFACEQLQSSCTCSTLCTALYKSPKYDKDCTKDFMPGVMPKYVHLLIDRNFIICVLSLQAIGQRLFKFFLIVLILISLVQHNLVILWTLCFLLVYQFFKYVKLFSDSCTVLFQTLCTAVILNI